MLKLTIVTELHFDDSFTTQDITDLMDFVSDDIGAAVESYSPDECYVTVDSEDSIT
jgi:hypothetical protein